MTMHWDFAFEQLTAYLLVFCRMTGVILFNPILARRNMPTRFTLALCLGIALLLTPMVAHTMAPMQENLVLVVAIVAELLIGFVWGLIFQLFYYLLFMVGDAIDMSLGMSMAKVFDQSTNMQMSLSGNIFNLMFVLFLFATNSHISLLRLAMASFDLIGIGGAALTQNLNQFMLDVFVEAVTLSIRIALPFLAATFTVEVIMGVLMKLVPQINIFSIHFQAKVIMGLILLYAFTVPVSNFMDAYVKIVFQAMEKALYVML